MLDGDPSRYQPKKIRHIRYTRGQLDLTFQTQFLVDDTVVHYAPIRGAVNYRKAAEDWLLRGILPKEGISHEQ